jgi:hypothetical protein
MFGVEILTFLNWLKYFIAAFPAVSSEFGNYERFNINENTFQEEQTDREEDQKRNTVDMI